MYVHVITYTTRTPALICVQNAVGAIAAIEMTAAASIKPTKSIPDAQSRVVTESRSFA